MNILKDEYLRLYNKIAELKALARIINMDLLLLVTNVEEFPEAKGELENIKTLVKLLTNESDSYIDVLDPEKLTLNNELYEDTECLEEMKVSEDEDEDRIKQEESLSQDLFQTATERENIANGQNVSYERTGLNDTFQSNGSPQAVSPCASDTTTNTAELQPLAGEGNKAATVSGFFRKFKCFVCERSGGFLSLDHCCRTHDKEFIKEGGAPLCVFCGKYFKTLRSLRSHRKVHKYRCFKCGEEFQHEDKFNHHIQINSCMSLDTSNCRKKDTQEPKVSGVDNVSYFSTVNALYKCSVCDKEFKAKNSLSIHSRIHSENYKEDDVQICAVCGKQCKSKIAMISHNRIHENSNKVYKCTKCEKEFRHKWQYNRHLQLHASKSSFVCDTCGKTFKTMSNLKCHVALIHMKKYQQECNLCGKLFTRMSNLTRHLRSHHGDKPYECSICFKLFAKMDSCRSHEKKHLGNYAHPCPNCGKGFDFLSQLQFHQKRFHSEGLPCSCSICGQTFVSNAEAQLDKNCHGPSGIHNLVCGEIKRYKCILCTAGFGQKVPFALHLMSAHLEQLSSCPVCGDDKVFTSTRELELHLVSVHLKSKGRKRENSSVDL